MTIEITHTIELRNNGKETLMFRAIEIQGTSGKNGRPKDLGQISSIRKSSIRSADMAELTDRLLFWGQAAFSIDRLSTWQKTRRSLYLQLMEQVRYPNQKALDRFIALSGSQIPWREALVQRLENIQSEYKLRSTPEPSSATSFG